MAFQENSESIFDQAEQWFARLRAEHCSTAERLAFEAWRAADPAHAAAYARTMQLWNELSGLADDPELLAWRREALGESPAPGAAPFDPAGSADVEVSPRAMATWTAQSPEYPIDDGKPGPGMDTLLRTSARIAAARGSRRMACASCWAIAASLLVTASLIGYWALHRPVQPTLTSRYVTSRGELREITLADGSKLTMNADTALEVSMGPQARVVRLSSGEAVFEIAHDAQRRFTVYAGGNIIHDIGTRFDVNIADAQTDITVLEGVVSVVREDKTATLTRGNRLAAGNAIWRQRRVDPSVATGWLQGKLVFRETPLGEAVAQANRYGPDRLVIADRSLENLPISGDFRIGQTASLVRALQSAFPIRARADKASGEIRLSRR